VARVVLAGIDEAGLGPLLGSLAIGYAILAAPEEQSEPWRLLRGRVARSARARSRLVVADSKQVFRRNRAGERRLETTALSFLAQGNGGRVERDPERFFFGPLAPAGARSALPWRGDLPALPWACEPDSLELSSALLARALARAGLELLDAGVRAVPAGELNASFARTENKAASVWSEVLVVLRHVWARRVVAPVRVTVDMLGGRRRYGPLLGRAFPEARVELVEEREGRSAYSLSALDGSGTMALEFRVRGDRHVFATALASCLAKYARELEMRAFNAYFARLQPELAPTAGYRGDGARWLADATPALERAGLARELLVRGR
jgi:ribonuclease HII